MSSTEEKLRIGDDNICPVTKEPCDDETCTPGAECNVSGTYTWCQGELEEKTKCEEQCDHCKEYYAPIEGKEVTMPDFIEGLQYELSELRQKLKEAIEQKDFAVWKMNEYEKLLKKLISISENLLKESFSMTDDFLKMLKK